MHLRCALKKIACEIRYYISNFANRRNTHVGHVSPEFRGDRVFSFRYLRYQIDQGAEEGLFQIQIELPDDDTYSSGRIYNI